MNNKAMERKLKAKKAIDISGCPRTRGGDYILGIFIEDRDYCDASQEAWVWSIGKLLEPAETIMQNGDIRELPAGTFLARLDSNHYSMGKSAIVECVWLR